MRVDRMQALAIAAGALLLTGGPAASAWAQTGSGEISQLAFAAVDTDGNGSLTEAELAADQAKRFSALDMNHDRVLARDELAEHDAAAFKRIDKDGDGRLSFREVMDNKLDDFAKADTDGDARLSPDEVKAFAARK